MAEIAFAVKYPENNGRTDGVDPWSVRQTGIYQSFDSRTKSALWILLNPRHGTVADARIRSLLNAQEHVSLVNRHQPLIGLIVISTYFANWRAYMAYYEEEELRMVISSSLDDGRFPNDDLILSQSNIITGAVIDEKLQFSHSTLSGLRRIEGRLLGLPSIFQSLIDSIGVLDAFNDALQGDGSISSEDHKNTQEILQNYVAMAAAYNSNAVYLLQKIQGTAQLLADTLNLKHQQTAQRTSENTLALNDAAVKDSATIRVITVVTLLYLPASFIAVSTHPR